MLCNLSSSLHCKVSSSIRATVSFSPPSFLTPQPMAFTLLVLVVIALAAVPETAEAVHHNRAPPPTPVWPPPEVCVPYLDICDRCDCGAPGWTLDFSICDNYCCRPVVPPVASPGLSAVSTTTSSASAAAECFTTGGFPGLFASAAAAASGQGSTAMSTTLTFAAECVAPLAGLSTACGAFLTRSDPETPATQSKRCAELVTLVNGSSTAADDDGDRDLALRCMSPVVLRHANKLLERPLDPTRIMYLPMQCGVVFPPETLYVYLTGRHRPPLVSRIPEGWEKPV